MGSLPLVLSLLLHAASCVETRDLAAKSFPRIYNPYRLGPLWSFQDAGVSGQCYTAVRDFLVGLRNDEVWAVQMTGASAHNFESLLWGNKFLTGSYDLCQDVRHNRTSSQAPYMVAFYVVRAKANFTIGDLKSRELHLGLCLPKVCSAGDVGRIVEFSASIESKWFPLSLDVVKVRVLQESYPFWQDGTFRIMGGCCFILVLLMASGTFYDLRRNRSADIKCKKPDTATPATWCKALCDAPKTYSAGVKIDIQKEMDPGVMSKVNDTLSRILLSFSIPSNVKKLVEVKDSNLMPLDGLRVLSLTWIVAFHCCSLPFIFSDNGESGRNRNVGFVVRCLTSGPLAVDNFFVISGLLLTLLHFQRTAKESKINATNKHASVWKFFKMVLQRILRLAPPYMFVLGALELYAKWAHQSSVFEDYTGAQENCPKYWWRNLLFVNTIFPDKEMCMRWSWYLTNDTLFYAIGAALLMVAASSLALALVIGLTLLISSWCVTGYISYLYEQDPSQEEQIFHFDVVYSRPWTRIGPYLIGMLTGWILFKTNCKINMNRAIAACGWVLTVSSMFAVMFLPYVVDHTRLTSAIYLALSRSVWSLCVGWMIISCCTGFGGFFNNILSWKGMYPFARLTFCAYLIHPLTLRVMLISRDQAVHLSAETLRIFFYGQLTYSYALAAILSICLELPVVSLLRIIFPARTK